MINLFAFISLILALAPSQSQSCNSTTISGCASYDTNNTYALADCGCLSCDPGLTLAVGLLSCCDTTFQHCLTCDSSNVCQACELNYYLNSTNCCTLCNSSMLNCLTCSNSSTCTNCSANFTIAAGVCSACSTLIPNCLTCSNSSDCSTCQSTYIVSANHTCQACSTVFANCSDCTSLGCTLCINHYGLNSSNVCALCEHIISFCAICYDFNSSCFWCHDGYFLNSSTLQCDRCSNYINKCSICPNNSYCSFCQAGYGFNDTHDCVECILYLANCSSCNDIHQCYSCIMTMTFNDSRVCVPCYEYMKDCDICYSNRTNCSSCNASGLVIDSSTDPDTCVSCSLLLSYCVNCTLTTFCTACIDSFSILVYQNVTNQVCLPCNNFIQGCYTCTSNSSCSSCLTTKQYLFNSTSRTCIKCSYYLSNCSTCSSTVYCLSCQDHRFALAHLNSNMNTQVCQLCSDFMLNCLYCQSSNFCSLCLVGFLLTNSKGCSGVKGCIEINPLAPVATNCLSCDPISFKTTPEDGKCLCASGKLVGNQCTPVVGCTGVKVVKGKVVCVSCDKTSKFLLLGQFCECMPYYELLAKTCVQTCGDGFLISYQCDDGNKVNGDGCSDKCEIQHSFVCRSDNDRYPASPASECQFKQKIQLVLSSIDKTLEPNSVQAIFDIVPYDSKLESMNVMANFKLTADACTVANIQISSGQLHVVIVYSKDITGEDSTISAKFDPQYVLSPDFTLRFSMVESSGIPLKYSSSQAISQNNILMVKVLSLLALAVFLVGSFAFKMIGLQTLFTIQIIWFTLATSKYYKTLFAHFQSLNYSYGQISTFLGSGTGVSVSGYKRMGFNGGMGDLLLLTIVDWGLFIGYCGVLVYQSTEKEKLSGIESKRAIYTASKFKILRKECEGKVKTTGKLAQSIYNWALFPFVIGFQLHLFHALSIQIISPSHSQGLSSQMVMLCLSLALTSFLFFRELIVRNQENESIMLRMAYRNIYIPNFLICNLIIFFLLSFLLTNASQLVYFALIAIQTFQTVYIIIFTPYNSNFDNFCLVFNHFAILFSLAWIIMKGLPFYDSFIQLLCVYAFIGLSYSVVALGLLRSLIAIKRTYFPHFFLTSKTVPAELEEKPAVAIVQKIIKSKLTIQTSEYEQLKNKSSFREKINRFRTDEPNITQKQSFRLKATRTLIDHP